MSNGTITDDRIAGSIARDSEISWGNLSGIPADLVDGDQVGIISENDPQVGSNTTNYVPKWNGSSMETGSIYNADSGDVGIGTTPNSKLHVNGAADENALRVQVNGNSKLTVASNGGVSVGAFQDNPPSNGLYVNGMVGVGKTAPNAKLEVNGAIKIADDSATCDSAKAGSIRWTGSDFQARGGSG